MMPLGRCMQNSSEVHWHYAWGWHSQRCIHPTFACVTHSHTALVQDPILHTYLTGDAIAVASLSSISEHCVAAVAARRESDVHLAEFLCRCAMHDSNMVWSHAHMCVVA